MRGEGTHKGRPYGWLKGCPRGGRAPTRGAPTVGYGVHARGRGNPQGVPLRLDMGCTRGGRAPTRGAPTVGYGVHARGEGTYKGLPLRLDDVGAHTGGGRPQGVPLRLDNEGALAGGGRPQEVPLPDSDSLRWVCPNLMQFPWGEQRGYVRRAWVRRGRPRTEGGGRWSGAGETPAAPGCSPAARLKLPDNHQPSPHVAVN